MGVDRGYIINMECAPPIRTSYVASPLSNIVGNQKKPTPLSDPARVGRFYYLGSVVIQELRWAHIYHNASNIHYENRPISSSALRSARIYSNIQKSEFAEKSEK